MPLTAKEKMRRYRERLKNERPEEYEAQRKKNLKRIKTKKKKISEMTAEEAEIQRKKWREEKRKSREVSFDNKRQGITSTHNEDLTIVVTLNAKTTENKNNQYIKLASKYNLFKKCSRFKSNAQKLTRLIERYKKRWQRTEANSKLTIQSLESTIDKLKARNEILESTLTNTYRNCNKNCEKRIMKKLVQNSRNKSYMTQMLGLKGKARQGLKNTKIRKNDEIHTYYLRDDVTRNTAGKKEVRTKNKQKKQIRYMLDTLVNLYGKYRKEGGHYGFTTFYKQKPFFILSPLIKSRNTCLCIKHSNIEFQYNALKRQGLLKLTLKETLQQLTCDIDSYMCMYDMCKECRNEKLKFPNDAEILQQNVTWNQWIREDHTYNNKQGQKIKAKKTVKSTQYATVQKLITNFNRDIQVFKKHYYNVGHQLKEYQKVVSTLKENEALIVCDFSENFECKMANEIQSMHFGASKTQITLHTGMIFWKSSAKSFCTISDTNSHQPAAIWAHLTPVLDLLKEKTPEVDVIHYYSDGPSSQYRQKANFYLHSYFTSKYNFRYSTWSFYEAGHEKSVADGIGGCIKRTLDKKVCYGADITNAEEAFHVLQKCKIKVQVYLIQDKKINCILNILPKKLPVLQGTMKLHQIITCDGTKIKYRDVSCFCEPLRGNCSCYSPKIHILYSNGSTKDKDRVREINELLKELPKTNKNTKYSRCLPLLSPSTIQKPAEANKLSSDTETAEIKVYDALTLEDINFLEDFNDPENSLDLMNTDGTPLIVLPEKICAPTVEFLSCQNCSLTILDKNVQCMVCKNNYCSDCGGESFIDYICDACLEGDDYSI